MNDINKTMQEAATAFTEQLKALMPTVSVNKNGYEIRSKILEVAQHQEWQEFSAKIGQFEATTKKEGGELVTTVTYPAMPSADKVLETAQKFYDFVNNQAKK